MTSLSILLMGLLLGMKHATEADHLAAVATLVTRDRTLGQAVRHGVAWGIGHTIVLSAFAGAVLALGTQIPESVAGWLELLVGLMLVGLGIDVIVRLARRRVHFHVHEHEDGVRHVHATGNEADVAVADLAWAVAHDPGVRLLLLYLETIANPELLAQTAEYARGRDLPIVAVKAGRSASGQRAASSHTGALANEDRVVDAFFRHHGIWRVRDPQALALAAEAYLKYLYTDAAQETIAKHFYRPYNEAILKKHASVFPSIRLFSIKEIATSFADAHKQFIAEGGVFDTIYKPSGR